MHLHQVLTGAVNPGDCCYSVGSVNDIPFTVRIYFDIFLEMGAIEANSGLASWIFSPLTLRGVGAGWLTSQSRG